MSARRLYKLAFLVIVSFVAAAGAFYLEFFVLSAPTDNKNSPPPQSLISTIAPSEPEPFVFDEPEVDLGAVKETVSHRFTYRNTGSMPLTITNVKPSCSCAVSQPDRKILQPGESGSITLEANISRKEPGAHLFLLHVEYECGDRKTTATASLRLAHQPDLYIAPRNLDFTVTEGTRSSANLTVIDYRKEPLKIVKIRPSSPALEAKIVESPSEYLPGWRHVIEVAYQDTPKETRQQFSEQILIETSDPGLPLLTISVDVHRLERLRIAPQAVVLYPDHPVAVILRDSLGDKVAIVECDTAGFAEASFTKEEGAAKKISLSLPRGKIDASKYPATIWVKVSKPCERRIPIRVSLAAAKGP